VSFLSPSLTVHEISQGVPDTDGNVAGRGTGSPLQSDEREMYDFLRRRRTSSPCKFVRVLSCSAQEGLERLFEPQRG